MVKNTGNVITKNGETFVLLSDEEQEAMLTWDGTPWRKLERYIYKLQKRIYKASECGDVKKMRRLQRTLLRSWSNRMMSVRKVTQDNRGKRTAGIDGIKNVQPAKRLEMVKNLKVTAKAKPTRRVWIPKANGEKRPLGIPTINDRALQNMVKAILEPEWEAKFEPNSYGFRPSRSCHDAIRQIKLSIQHKDKYVLDADIAKCFDRIDHEKLLTKLNVTGKIRKQIKAWLRSGVFDENTFTKTEMGTPQGGVISPLLANIALHGMENALMEYVTKIPMKLHKEADRKKVRIQNTNFIRYADDFVIMHYNKEFLIYCKQFINTWLNDIGLELKPEKTRLTHTLENNLSEDGKAGFDFLGFHIQQYKAGKHKCSRNTHNQLTGFITLITPTKKSCLEHQRELGDIIRKNKSVPQGVLIKRLNPVITGWSNYYKHCDIKTVGESNQQDYLMYLKLRRWAKRRCKNNSQKGYVKYWHKCEYTMLNGEKSTRIAFNTGSSVKDYSIKYHCDVECSSTKYVKVRGNKSPFDGDLIYWATRKGNHPELDTKVATLLKKQKGKCAECGLYFLNDGVMEVDHIIPKSLGGKDEYKNLQLLHGHCHDTKTKEDGSIDQRKTNLKVNKHNKVKT